MLSKIQKWGNSQGIRIPKGILEDSKIEIGEDVDISIKDGTIVIKPVKKIRGRYDLKELVAKMPQNHTPHEEDWGDPEGQEV
ncbi:MAG: AbrB/MazE/SpoVT family DNA-binding domain-containing protein [bacterium]|nr:AbrB/MazE/SpoVT family DNA-binding domain-containing protein [bacterium]MCP4798422.1 AbrB/MazE/SpoVT family DNA-binding domain-containing protein [bacterium]